MVVARQDPKKHKRMHEFTPQDECYCPTGNIKFTSFYHYKFKATSRFLVLGMTMITLQNPLIFIY